MYWLDRLANKILNLLFKLEIILVYTLVKYTVKRKKSVNKNYAILALPYYTKYGAGGHSRIGDWQAYFNEDSIVFDIHWASELNEFENESRSNNPFKRYWFFQKVFYRRVRVLYSAHQYDTVFVQRAVIPFFPFDDAYFERVLSEIDNKFIIDYYDADYVSNYRLTINGANSADKVTVASQYLKDYFKRINMNTFYIPFAMDYKAYRLKDYKVDNSTVTIGWMGSIENFSFVRELEEVLMKLDYEFPNIKFSFICREKFKLNLRNYEFQSWGDPAFDYFETVSSFDIGLAPFHDQSETTLAKTSFKALEYMSSGIAFVCSPLGMPNHLVHKKNVMIAENHEEWYVSLKRLVADFELRKELGRNARITISEHYDYAKVYSLLKNVLVNV